MDSKYQRSVKNVIDRNKYYQLHAPKFVMIQTAGIINVFNSINNKL